MEIALHANRAFSEKKATQQLNRRNITDDNNKHHRFGRHMGDVLAVPDTQEVMQMNHRMMGKQSADMLTVPMTHEFVGLKGTRQDSFDSSRGGLKKRVDSIDSSRGGLLLNSKRDDSFDSKKSGILSINRFDSLESNRGGSMIDRAGADSYDSMRGVSQPSFRTYDSIEVHMKRSNRNNFENRGGHRRAGSSGNGSLVFQDEPDCLYDSGEMYMEDHDDLYARPQNNPYASHERYSRYGRQFNEHEISGDDIPTVGKIGKHLFRHEPKQVRFTEQLPKSTKVYREMINSDSSFSDNDEGVEHLFQSPQYMKTQRNINRGNHYAQIQSDPPIEATDFRSVRSQQKQKVYFDEFESDHSNYDNSREGSDNESPTRHTVVKHKPPLPILIPRVVASDYNGNQQYVLHEPYGNVPAYGCEPELPMQPLPPESGSMLERYLQYYGVEADDIQEKHLGRNL